MSLIVPHWIPSNLWWALPLLAAALGAALRRVLPRTAAARGAPVCLLAGLAGTLIWRGALVAGLASRGRIWSTGLPLLALAVLAAGGAVACALLDDRRGSAMAAQPAQPAARPNLACVAGAFSGASFPVQPGETLCLGSDPACCQIVLPGTAAAARQCLLQYDSVRGWQGRGLPGTVTYINGVQPLDTEAFQPLPAGTLLCINQGRNSQRFRIQ